ncbi:MAG: baseplate J/gp47 family protein [Microbispora sp.]|nr:baseplate J/gp47 family protein [Microbispora sp.]
MPFERPTLTRLIEQAQTDVASALGLYALLRHSPERAFAVALAGLAQGLYGYVDWIALQAVPYTATDEYLEAWAALVGVTRKAATQASGSVAFTGAAGSVVPAGTMVIRPSDGAQYITTAGVAVAGDGTVTVPVQASEAGAAGNADIGTTMVLGAAIVGVNSTGSVSVALAGGADLETDDDLRTRMLAAYQNPPQGGAGTDYVEWALQVPGVTRAWAAPNGFGPGTVVVYIMLDDVRAGAGGFPSGTDGVAAAEPRDTAATGDQLLVADHILPLQPVTALVYVVAPVAAPVNLTINDLNDASLRPAIQAALTDMLRQKAEVGGTLYPSDFIGAIEAVPGVTRFSMPAPSGPVTAAAGHLHTLGTITWG